MCFYFTPIIYLKNIDFYFYLYIKSVIIINFIENMEEQLVEENQLQNFVNWEKISTWWLHFVWTPDTEELMTNVKNKIQALLTKAHSNAQYPSVKETISSQSIKDYTKFASWESISTLKKSVRWKHVYVFSDPSWDYQNKTKIENLKETIIKLLENEDEEIIKELFKLLSHSSLNDKFVHDLLLLSAIKTHWAKTTNLVKPCIPYARQDDMTPKKRQPASLEFIWNIISSITWDDGYVMTIDVHNNSAARWNFSKTNFVNFYTWWFIEECIKDIWEENIVLSWADQWWDKKIKAIAKEQKLKKIIVVKDRDYSKENTVDETEIYWDVEWKDILIHDDMLDTGWTMCKLLEKMLKKKPKSINIAVTHGMFNWEALKKLEKTIIESNWIVQNIYMTNSINKEWLPDFVKVIDLSNIIANNIVRKYKGLWLERNDNTDYTKK